jgi:uncharacterized protein (TIGR02453 family)
MAFTGFHAGAFEFYERLEADNSRLFWAAHQGEYQQLVREPMEALAEELEAEFGPASLFRPHRDTRFSADKSPYKTHQGMFIERVPGTGLYLQVSADGMLASGGFHSHGPDQVERYRHAVDAEPSGALLAGVVADLAAKGLSMSGDQLKTRPRGVPAGHPRVGLLRYRSLTAGRDWPPGPQLASGRVRSLIEQTWRDLVPLCDWMCEYVGEQQP